MTKTPLHQGRFFFSWLDRAELSLPVILVGNYPLLTPEEVTIRAAAELGGLLTDGLGEGLLLKTSLSPPEAASLSFAILQGCRMRATQTEFIACPGCGRTLFNLQEVTRQVRAKTSHLPGVKIAIMGCIVNGPGEMVDADFGYVGSTQEHVDLYVGKTCVERRIHHSHAVDRLITLIQAHGRWTAPPQTQASPTPHPLTQG